MFRKADYLARSLEKSQTAGCSLGSIGCVIVESKGFFSVSGVEGRQTG